MMKTELIIAGVAAAALLWFYMARNPTRSPHCAGKTGGDGTGYWTDVL